MSAKKQQSRKNKSRSNKKQQHKHHQFFIGGNCAMCGACMGQNTLSPLFRGGKKCTLKRRRGGNDNPSGFTGSLPLRYYYHQNQLEQDPNRMQIATRQVPNIKGGKNKKTAKTKKGGGLSFSYFNGQMAGPSSFNPLNTIGDIATSQIGANYLSGDVNSSILPNPSIFSQPVETKYNIYNMPMA
jgi:hypothetical protein